MPPAEPWTIALAGRALREGAVTAVGLVEEALTLIDRYDSLINAFVCVTGERALAEAACVDAELGRGLDRGPLHGIPYGLKDIFDVRGVPTTCCSKLQLDSMPKADCTVQERLREAGAVLLGKLTTHEYALGGPSFELPFPPARNPWSLDHVPGASSSGSGAAVAAGMVAFSLGSDTSGSIRGPACHCGVVGIKPTFGAVSRRGVFPLSYSLDHCGPLAWTVEDASLALDAVTGFDPLDLASVRLPAQRTAEQLEAGVSGVRIGYARAFFTDAGSVHPAVLAALDQAAETLATLGATVEEVTLPPFDRFNACGRIIMTAEGHAIHEADLRNRPLDFGRYTYQRLAPGAGLTAVDLVQAMRLRRELTAELNRGPLAEWDVLLTACSLAPAGRFADFGEDWPPPPDATAMWTIPFNVTGNPVLAMPCGRTTEGLPIGLQFVGRAFDERLLARIGGAFERETEWSSRRPNLDQLVSSAGFTKLG